MAGLFWELMYLSGGARWDTGVVPPEVRAFIEAGTLASRARALEIGCGTGTNVVYLGEHGVRVMGVDVSRYAVRRARRRIANAGLATACSALALDATRLDPLNGRVRGPFDLVLDIGCFHGLTVPDRCAYTAAVEAWLAPGGYVLMYAHVSGHPASAAIGSDLQCARTASSPRARLHAAIRLVARRSPPPRPARSEIEALLGPFCQLVSAEDGIDRGRPAVWLTWRRWG